MVKGRGKGKKQTTPVRDDAVSGDDEKQPVRRRGRPQKLMKDDMGEEEELEKMEEEEEENERKIVEKPAAAENGRKRKRAAIAKKNPDLVNEENGDENRLDMMKAVGLKRKGSRRKSKPRRAAEVGVECN